MTSSALARGQLHEAEAGQLGQHVLTCSSCANLLNEFQASDPLIPDLQAARGQQPPDNPFVDSLIERLVRTPPDKAGDTPSPADAQSATDLTSTPAVSGMRPEWVPGFEILGELGRGGMGVVYKARHMRLNRLVALKMVRAGALAGSEELVRFQAEAEAVAELQHPHIVQLHEVGDAEGQPFFCMEFVEGGSLDRRLNGTPLSSSAAARLVETLARAVHYAHQRGIVHRDLKPANILLVSGGHEPPDTLELSGGSRSPLADLEPKITDFGLAKRLEVPGQTQSGDVLGTPSYMAPEQALGKAKAVGPATDVYALGAILYECLTGRPPFQSPTPLDTLWQVIHEEPLSPARLQPKVPHDLATICLKCLRKRPTSALW